MRVVCSMYTWRKVFQLSSYGSKPDCYQNRKNAHIAFAFQDGIPVQTFVAEVLDQIVGISVIRDEMVISVPLLYETVVLGPQH